MKFLVKYAYWLVGSILFLLLLLFGLRFYIPGMPGFYIENAYGNEKISITERADGLLCVFLPSYAEMQNVKISVPLGCHAYIDQQLLQSDMDCSAFEIGQEYEYKDANGSRRLVFFRSANVASMFIETVSGSMEFIHEGNDTEERADINIHRADGSLDGSFSGGSLKSRGNTTRLFGIKFNTKRPYTLTLPSAAETLGMPSAAKWVLMANASDETNLRNRIIYEIADEVWPDGGHNSAWVDLYLNGEYSGLYLLSEKVESGENRLDIDLDAGDFLCKIELNVRLGELRNGFITNLGRAVEICEPRSVSDTEYNRIISLVNEMEQSLVSGGDLKLKANIDLDSWAHRYIIDEISTNIDADSASSYFYYKDGVFYAGPLWDYDLSLGNHFDWEKTDGNPCIFVAKPHNQFSQPGSSYYLSLCDNESFMQRVAELYSQDYMPVLKALYSGGINELAESIDGALKMDKQRWIANIPYKGESPDDIEKYLAVRSEFLHSAWVDGVKYHSIRVDPAAQNPRFFSVKDGECFDPALLQDYDCLWLDAQTGESYDFSQAVKDDVYIRAQTEAVYYEEENLGDGPNIRETLTVLSIIALLAVFAVLLMVDLRQRRQERKCSKTPAQEISFIHFRSFVKFIYKYAYWLAGSILFILLLIFCLQLYTPAAPAFRVENPSGSEDISIIKRADGQMCVFLPSYAEMQNVKASVPPGSEVYLDKQLLLDGMNCSSFEIGREYEYADNESHYTFVFYRSADVPSMFIDTLSDSMKSIHEDNNNEERSDLSVYLPDGSLDSSFSGGSLKGRGNGTRIFGNSYQTKRPYTLKLPAAAEILGMPEASNWVLLANATDETNLRNRIIYEIADEVWPDGGHNSAWVDLYLNGEYSGLYLLSEKVESGENRLDIDLDAGDFLCKIELPRRFEELRNGFFTDCGRAVEVCEPRAMSDAEYNRIISLVNEMEQSLVSGEDLNLKENIDLDSWVHRYIIDEISGNLDADRASAYFYYKDGVFYAGPLWDYDLSFGNPFGGTKSDGNPCVFVAKPHNQFSQPGSSYYLSLCDNKSFMQRVAELYWQDYMPVLEDLYSGGINELAGSIDNALKMDRQRWLANIPYTGERAEDIEQHLAVRSEFLRSAWVDGVKYHSIRVDPAAQNPRFFSVKDGECFDPALLQDYDCLWLDAQTGESYDFSQAVKDDVYIRAQTEAVYYEEESLGDGPNIRETLTVLSIIALLPVYAVHQKEY